MAEGIDKAFLEDCLAKGMSLPEIGMLVSRDPSTVGYWVSRHGLVANGASRYSAKGPLNRDALIAALDRGCSVREIADDLGVGQGRVRYWMQRYGLKRVGRQERNEAIARARGAGRNSVMLNCPRHGTSEFWLSPGRARCRKCNAEGVSRRRKRVKEILVEESGGACLLCGYNRSCVALEFHHLDPLTKSFGISQAGITRSIEAARKEVEKCVLLCANCHAEVEAGVSDLPVE